MASATKTTPALQVINGHAETKACWSCGDMRAAHFCDSCGKLQPALPADYFSFFGFPRKLNIDVALLEQEFYRLSRKLHPDLYVVASEQEREWSLEKSSQLNDAYRTLRDPIARTEYVLRLEGVKVGEQSKIATEEARSRGQQKKQAVPPALLEEVFELNLQLEEFRAGKRMGELDADLARQLSDARGNLEAKLEALSAELESCWVEWDALITRAELGREVTGGEHQQICGKMLDVLNRSTYIRNLVRDVNEALED